MLNEDLLSLVSPKDKEIAKLKRTIDKFKKYDKERKEYYREALIELGELKEFVESDDITYAMSQKIKNYKKTITDMTKSINYCKALEAGIAIDKLDSEDVKIAVLQKKISDLKKDNEKYLLEIVKLRKELNDKINEENSSRLS